MLELHTETEQEHVFAPIVYEKGLEDQAHALQVAIHNELRVFLTPLEVDLKAHSRQIHAHSRNHALSLHKPWLEKKWPLFRSIIADPRYLKARRISPRLVLATTQRHRDIFRFAQLTWSLPFSGGYGRRMNYLIWDDGHNSLMGVLGLQSPPLALPARDRKFPMAFAEKPVLVNQTMDAYVLGAIAPYADLLGGKLIVLAAASSDIREDYSERYRDRVTRIEQRVLPATLVAITTLSAFGRSSMYNRVSAGTENGETTWATESLGACEGWGTAHFSRKLYEQMKELYALLEPEKPLSGFGTGPKVRQQIVKRVLRALRLPERYVRHNVKREVFVIPHVTNLHGYLTGVEPMPHFSDKPFDSLAAHWLQRYCIPRSTTRCPLEGDTAIARALGLPVSPDAYAPTSFSV